MRKCIVCDRVQNDDISLHKLPLKKNIQEAWINFIKIAKGSWQEKKHVFVCNLQFDASSYKTPLISNQERIYLKPDAIPSILSTDVCSKIQEYNEEHSTVLYSDTEYIINTEGQTQSIASQIDTTIEEPRKESEQQILSSIYLESLDNIAVNNECTERIKNNVSLKRKRKQGHSIPEKRPRIQKPRYVGDINLNIFTDIEQIKPHWKQAMNTIHDLRKQNKVLRRKCQRYHTKIITLKGLITHLKQDKFISDDTGFKRKQ